MYRRTSSLWAACLAVGFLQPSSRAADFTWTGQATFAGQPNSLYSAFGNWSPMGFPGPGDNVTFATGFGSGTTISVLSNSFVNAFNVTTNTSFTLQPAVGSSPLYTILSSFSHSSSATVTFTLPVALQTAMPNFPLSVAGTVDFSGGVSIAPSSTLVKSGNGNVRIGGPFTGNLNISQGSVSLDTTTGTGTIAIAAAAALRLTAPLTVNHSIITPSGINAFVRSTGPFAATLTSATLVPGSALFLAPEDPAGLLRLNSVTATGAFVTASGAGTVEIVSGSGTAVLSSGRLRLPVNSSSFSVIHSFGTLELNGNVSIPLLQLQSNSILEVNGIATLPNAPQASSGDRIIKTGNGVLVLGPLNPQGFAIDIRRGTVDITASPAASSSSKTFTLNGGLLQAGSPSQILQIQVGASGGSIDFRDSGSGVLTGFVGSGHLRLTGPSSTNPATLTLIDVANFTGSITAGLPDSDAPVNLTTLSGLAAQPFAPAQPPSLTLFGRSTLSAAGPVLRNIAGTGTITASGSLTLGNPAAQFGFDFDGTLQVQSHAVTLADLDTARLGTLTKLSFGGILSAEVPILLASGRTLEASSAATVDAPLINHGTVDAPAVGPLLLTGPVSGTGTFLGEVEIVSTLTPGGPASEVSPAGLEFETLDLGGSAVVFADLQDTTAFDTLTVSGVLTIAPGAVLRIRLADGFVPPDLFRFELISAAAITGSFALIELPPELRERWFIDATPTSIALSNTRIIAEPSAVAGGLGCVMAVAGGRVRLRRRSAARPGRS
jgi:autotransporter-associated beta strand protein